MNLPELLRGQAGEIGCADDDGGTCLPPKWPCSRCQAADTMRKAADEIERLTAVSNVAVQEAARWLFAFRDRDSHAPDYVSPVEIEQRMRRAIDGEAARLLRQRDTSEPDLPLTGGNDT